MVLLPHQFTSSVIRIICHLKWCFLCAQTAEATMTFYCSAGAAVCGHKLRSVACYCSAVAL